MKVKARFLLDDRLYIYINIYLPSDRGICLAFFYLCAQTNEQWVLSAEGKELDTNASLHSFTPCGARIQRSPVYRKINRAHLTRGLLVWQLTDRVYFLFQRKHKPVQGDPQADIAHH